MTDNLNHYCDHCKKAVEWTLSDDPLLPLAMVCEICGSELYVLPTKTFDPDPLIDEFRSNDPKKPTEES